MRKETVRQIAHDVFGCSPFDPYSHSPKYAAQRELQDKTHYVDDDTLRFHKSRILKCVATDHGAFLAIIESVALDPYNNKRGFRPVIFDLAGNIAVERKSLDQSHATRKAAESAMWESLDALDVREYYRDTIKEKIDRDARRLSNTRAIARKLK